MRVHVTESYCLNFVIDTLRNVAKTWSSKLLILQFHFCHIISSVTSYLFSIAGGRCFYHRAINNHISKSQKSAQAQSEWRAEKLGPNSLIFFFRGLKGRKPEQGGQQIKTHRKHWRVIRAQFNNTDPDSTEFLKIIIVFVMLFNLKGDERHETACFSHLVRVLNGAKNQAVILWVSWGFSLHKMHKTVLLRIKNQFSCCWVFLNFKVMSNDFKLLNCCSLVNFIVLVWRRLVRQLCFHPCLASL